MPEALGLGVGLDQREVLLVAAGEAQVVERHLVDREHRAGGAVLGGHVADGGARLERERRHAGAEASTNLPTTPWSRSSSVIVSTTSVAVMPGLGSPEMRSPTTGRQEHGERLAEHGGLGLDAADAPAEHAEPVDHRGVRVGADEGVAEGAPVLGGEDDPRQVLEVDLVADARARAAPPGSRRRRPGPSSATGSAPGCARTRWRRCGRRPTASPERSMITEWSMTSSTGTSGLTWAASPPRLAIASRMAARSTTAGHAGEVLHEHALGGEGDLVGGVARALAVALGVGAPGRHRHDVVGGHVRAVLVAQQVLQEDLDRVGQPGDVVALGQRRRLEPKIS